MLTAAPADLPHVQGPVGAGAAKPVAAAEGVVAVQRPRQSAARAREVQVLLDSVGGSSRRPPQSNTIVVGDKRGCAALPQSVRDEIQQHLNEAAAADKAKRVEGRYGAAGVALEQKRRSPILEIALLLAECVQHGLRTIAFCKTRKVCELVTSYTRDVLRETAPLLAARLAVYRSGYSAAERRAIEAALHSGDLCGVAATNALELGIDIGGLDVTLHLSFPGTVASLWQQAGRAGRREQTSLSIYVAFDGPLDQHFMRNPRKLFSRTIETPQVNPANAVLLQQHLVCAATELPLVPHLDHHFFGAAIHPCVAALCDAMKLVPTPGAPGAFHYIGGHARPAASVSLRTIDPDHFCIINEANGETLEQIEACKAFFEVYDGAVYLFHGRPYLCKRLDLTTRVAHVVAADVRYYTKPVHNRDVHVTGSRLAYTIADRPQFGRTSARVGPAVVTERFMAFVRIWRGSGIAFDRVDLFLPDIQFTTEAAYVRVPPSARAKCEEAGVAYREGLHAAGHAMVNVLPLFMSCNPADMRAECDNPYATRFRPERLLMYDSHPGGLGLSAEAGPMFTGMMREALQLITRCDCTEETGCPSCIHFSCCDAYNATLSKQAAVIVLAATLQQELGPEAPGSSDPGEVQDVNAAS